VIARMRDRMAMTNRNQTVAITYNDEIDNHAEVRRELQALGKYERKTDHSDTEALLHAYEEWGLDALKRFYGMFAVGIYDARDPACPVLNLARDRVGIKPMYFARTRSGEWLFAAEIRTIVAHPDITPEMDRTAFWHYLTFIVAPAPLTMFRRIFKLPAGHTMSIDHTGHASVRQFWDCRPDRSVGTKKRARADQARLSVRPGCVEEDRVPCARPDALLQRSEFFTGGVRPLVRDLD